MSEWDIGLAIREIEGTYGDRVSVLDKRKSLTKFGLNLGVTTSVTTIGRFQGSVLNETFVSTNIIDRAVSTSASDTQTMAYEGHTIDGSGNLTFVVGEFTLSGTTPVALSTPVARVNRCYVKPSGVFNSPQALLVGNMYIYDSSATTVTAGTPNTPAATKLAMEPGESQSEKCQSAISQADYYIVTAIEAAIGASGGNASRVELFAESRDVKNGGGWRPLGREISLNINANGVQIRLVPHLIIPKNHDFRVRAKTDANTAAVFAEVDGYLAKIIN